MSKWVLDNKNKIKITQYKTYKCDVYYSPNGVLSTVFKVIFIIFCSLNVVNRLND